MTSFGPDAFTGDVRGVLRREPGPRKGSRSFLGLVEAAVEAVLATLDIRLPGIFVDCVSLARAGTRVSSFESSLTRVKIPDMMAYIPSGSAASRSLNASASFATASRRESSAVLSSTSWQEIPTALLYSLRPRIASLDESEAVEEAEACRRSDASVDAVEKREFLVGDDEADWAC